MVMVAAIFWAVINVRIIAMGTDVVAVIEAVRILGFLGYYGCRVICGEEDIGNGRTLCSATSYKEEVEFLFMATLIMVGAGEVEMAVVKSMSPGVF